MVLNSEPADCLLQMRNVSLPMVKEFKYLRVLFPREGMMGHEIDRRVEAVGAELHAFQCTVVMKRELSWKAKLSIYRSILVPTLTYGHD